jgi:SulP family sulfate permease
MTAIDATGLHAIEQLARRLHASGRTLLICGAREQPAKFLARADFVDHVGKENIVPHVRAALDRASVINSTFKVHRSLEEHMSPAVDH